MSKTPSRDVLPAGTVVTLYDNPYGENPVISDDAIVLDCNALGIHLYEEYRGEWFFPWTAIGGVRVVEEAGQ